MATPKVRGLFMDEMSDVHGFLAGLSSEHWDRPSLCGEWTVADVGAHLASFVGVPTWGLATRMARGGFNPTRANSHAVAAWRRRGSTATVETFAGNRVPALAKVYGRVGLTELVIHHQDMRRPLDQQRIVPEARLRVALGVAARWPMGTGAARRRRGVRLCATDIEWTLGDGPAVCGTAETILMALAGRPQVFAELSGEGVDRFGGAHARSRDTPPRGRRP